LLNQSTGWAKKVGPQTHGHNFVESEPIFKNNFTGRFLDFVVNWILKIAPHLAYGATLPCETFLSAKQSINNKLQGSVATYLRCGAAVNNQIKKGLLMSLRVNFFLNR